MWLGGLVVTLHIDRTPRFQVPLPFTRSAFGVRRSAFGVWRSAFGVRRLAFGVWRLAFGVLVLVLEALALSMRRAMRPAPGGEPLYPVASPSRKSREN
jgi:hypothetical protein